MYFSKKAVLRCSAVVTATESKLVLSLWQSNESTLVLEHAVEQRNLTLAELEGVAHALLTADGLDTDQEVEDLISRHNFKVASQQEKIVEDTYFYNDLIKDRALYIKVPENENVTTYQMIIPTYTSLVRGNNLVFQGYPWVQTLVHVEYSDLSANLAAVDKYLSRVFALAGYKKNSVLDRGLLSNTSVPVTKIRITEGKSMSEILLS